MKVYIAYRGYWDRHDRQEYSILGVYLDRRRAIKRIEDSIGSLDEIRVEERGYTTWWTEHGMDVINVGKLEEHGVIGERWVGSLDLDEEEGESAQHIDFTQIDVMDLAFTSEQLEQLGLRPRGNQN